MGNASQTRQSPRYELALAVQYQAWPAGTDAKPAGTGHLRNVSETGACLELPGPLPAGTQVSLVLEAETGILTLEATVVWGDRESRSGGGIRHGVVFVPLSLEQQQTLQALLHQSGVARSRIALPEPLPLRARATLEVRLLDLSLGGARIAHHALLRPGSPCTLEFPAALGPLVLTARVVRSALVGVEKEEATGDRLLRYESGLTFVTLTPDQRTALTQFLDRLGSGEGLAGTVTFP